MLSPSYAQDFHLCSYIDYVTVLKVAILRNQNISKDFISAYLEPSSIYTRTESTGLEGERNLQQQLDRQSLTHTTDSVFNVEAFVTVLAKSCMAQAHGAEQMPVHGLLFLFFAFSVFFPALLFVFFLYGRQLGGQERETVSFTDF